MNRTNLYKAQLPAVILNLATLHGAALHEAEVDVRLIACEPEEPLAGVLFVDIEQCTQVAVQAWRQRHNYNIEDYRKTCTLYLLPKGKTPTPQQLIAAALGID